MDGGRAGPTRLSRPILAQDKWRDTSGPDLAVRRRIQFHLTTSSPALGVMSPSSSAATVAEAVVGIPLPVGHSARCQWCDTPGRPLGELSRGLCLTRRSVASGVATGLADHATSRQTLYRSGAIGPCRSITCPFPLQRTSCRSVVCVPDHEEAHWTPDPRIESMCGCNPAASFWRRPPSRSHEDHLVAVPFHRST